MPDLDIPAIRRALAEATPGPWWRDADEDYDCICTETSMLGDVVADAPPAGFESRARWHANAALIVLLRNNAEALLRIAEAARDVLNLGPHMTCEEMHHGPGDQHGSLEHCPAVDRFRMAKDKLRAALGGTNG